MKKCDPHIIISPGSHVPGSYIISMFLWNLDRCFIIVYISPFLEGAPGFAMIIQWGVISALSSTKQESGKFSSPSSSKTSRFKSFKTYT